MAADVDADDTAEIVVLLVWDEWGSMMRGVSSSPGTSEVEVLPAIEERREIRVFELGDGALSLAAEPLQVGAEVLAIDAVTGDGPVVVLTDDGPARLTLAGGSAPDRVVSLDRIADVRPVMAGARRLFAGLSFVHRRGLSGGTEIFVPTSDGLAVVDAAGAVHRHAAPIKDVRSGQVPFLHTTFPLLVDADRDGSLDLLDVGRFQDRAWLNRVAFRKGLGGGRVAPARVWALAGLLEPTDDEREAGLSRMLADVADLDGDATLEAVIAVLDTSATSIRGALRAIRGQPGRLYVHALAGSGPPAAEPERVVDIVGHLFPLPQANGVRSPFRDLDGDARPELVTMTIAIGYFGAGRALIGGKARATIHPVVHRDSGTGYREIEDSVPPMKFKQDLRSFDLSRFFDFPGDLDGDGVFDLVEVDGNEIRLRLGRDGPRYDDDPTLEVELTGDVLSWLGVTFLDVDGDGDRDLIAFEPERLDDEAVSRRTRMEVVLPDYPR